MANLKEIKRRIGSVKNTQQITKAMKLVAAAKLRRVQEAVTAARPYADKVMEIMEGLAARAESGGHPLLERREVRNVLIVLLAGDKGLCGPFNSNVIKQAQRVIADNEGHSVSFLYIGRKGVDYFGKRSYSVLDKHLDYGKKLNPEFARSVSRQVVDAFIQEKYDKVYLIFNKFRNVVVQDPQAITLLPVSLGEASGEGDVKDPEMVDYEYEPSAEVVLGGLLDLYVQNQIFQSLLESAASENGARMTAMDAATKNAKEMIDNLTLEYNNARQAAITTQIIEVVTGADAMNG